MDEIEVHVETKINLTESEEKVKKAVTNLFSDLYTVITPFYQGSVLKAEAKGQEALVNFRNLLRLERIRDAARKALFGVLRDNTIRFCLNKQVAFVSHVSFSEEVAESPLGPIIITIKCEDPRQLINWLAARTA
jgi:predicted RNA binding protein with dsRBD fold (UPF0201 family)